MCGRVTLCAPADEIARIFGATGILAAGPRYNISPTQDLVTIRSASGSGRQLVPMRWGLQLPWAQSDSAQTINIRSETADKKPVFRDAFLLRRCLIIVDGFYEWQTEGKQKRPFHIRLRDAKPFALAGVWEQQGDPPVNCCAILTTGANELVAPLHNRMPAILQPDAFDAWLDRNEHDAPKLKAFLAPYAAAQMVAIPVSSWVNDPRHEGEKCLKPIQAQGNLF